MGGFLVVNVGFAIDVGVRSGVLVVFAEGVAVC